MSAARPARSRGRADHILIAAARLFRERGYHATGIDEIGAAVGISGPAVYRHYRSKEAVLAAIAEAAGERANRAFEEAASSTEEPTARLDAVVRAGVRVTLAHLDDVTVYLREWRHLGVASGRAVRDAERRNNRILVDAVLGERPELPEAQARMMIQSVVGLYLSVLHYRPPVSRARLEALMTTMAMAALSGPPALPAGEVREVHRRAFDHPCGHVEPSVERASRREVLLAAATRLFRDRGYSGVGIDEIGAAAGIAGPGLYRHFRSKEELLLAGFVRTQEQLAAGVTQAVERPTALEALEALVGSYVDVAIASADMLAVYLQDGHALRGEGRHAVARRQRWYVEEWQLVLQRVRPELNEADVRVAVQAAIGLVNGYAQGTTRFAAEHVRATLVAMAVAALVHPDVPAT